MPHALEYVIIQNAIFMLITKSFAKQIEWPRYFSVTQDEKFSQSSLYSWNFFFCFGIWVSSCWTLKAWYVRSLGSIPCFGAARDVVICNRLLWSLYSFPLDPLKNWFNLSAMLFANICNNHSSWQLQAVFQMNSDAPQKSKLKNNPKIETGKVLQSKLCKNSSL